jgi:hypothetical protein
MQIRFAYLHIGCISNAVIGKASLPHGNLRCETMRKPAFDEADGTLKRDDLRGEDEVDMVGHDDEGVELVMTEMPVVLQSLDEQIGICGGLKDAAPIVGRSGNEEYARAGCSDGDRHAAIVNGVYLRG